VFPFCWLPAIPSCSNDPSASRYGRKFGGTTNDFC
jgi:hypothetical protein